MATNRHIAYLNYLVRHKWWVLIAGIKIGAPLWRLLIHDASKFKPSEWLPYAKTFYDKNGAKQYKEDINFNRAWLHHQRRNLHHWQYWKLSRDDGGIILIEMPMEYVLEMVADWMGAGKAITGKWEIKEWYNKNKHKIELHEDTRNLVESIIHNLKV